MFGITVSFTVPEMWQSRSRSRRGGKMQEKADFLAVIHLHDACGLLQFSFAWMNDELPSHPISGAIPVKFP